MPLTASAGSGKEVPMRAARRLLLTFAVCLLAARGSAADDLADRLRRLDTTVIPASLAPDRMVAREVRERVHAAHRREAAAFEKVRTAADWERFRDTRIAALRAS